MLIPEANSLPQEMKQLGRLENSVAGNITAAFESGMNNSVSETTTWVSGLVNELSKRPFEYVARVGGPSLTRLRKR